MKKLKNIFQVELKNLEMLKILLFNVCKITLGENE